MARGYNTIGLTNSATEICKVIDYTMINKLALAVDMKKNQKIKYESMTTVEKRDEGVKLILKSMLVNHDDYVYRIRLQKYGGFSITMVGPSYSLISSIMYNRNLRNYMYNGAFAVIPEAEKALFLEQWNSIFENPHRHNGFHVIPKDNSVYLRCTSFGHQYVNGSYRYVSLFDVTVSAVAYCEKLKNFGEKLAEIKTAIDALGNVAPGQAPENIVFVNARTISQQLSDF